MEEIIRGLIDVLTIIGSIALAFIIGYCILYVSVAINEWWENRKEKREYFNPCKEEFEMPLGITNPAYDRDISITCNGEDFLVYKNDEWTMENKKDHEEEIDDLKEAIYDLNFKLRCKEEELKAALTILELYRSRPENNIDWMEVIE